MAMSTHQETIDALMTLYREVLKQPYLDDSALKVPPASGWPTIDIDGLRALGKTDSVIDMIRHLPYIQSEKRSDRHLIYYETTPVIYTRSAHTTTEKVQAIPGHCFYLTASIDTQGYNLIYDTDKATITAFTISGDHIQREYLDTYDTLASSEQWKAHLTMPAAEFLNRWTREYERLVSMLVPNIIGQPSTGTYHTRAQNKHEAERMVQETGPFEVWHPDLDALVGHVEDEKIKERAVRRWQQTANIYNCFLRYGWPDNFDKDKCRLEVIEQEKEMWALEKR